jgi:hypothetical protein
MSDQVMITWTDSTGTYENSFLLENPTLEEVRQAQSGFMMMPMPQMGGAVPETDAQFYARISFNMVNQIMQQAQQMKQNQLMASVPPVTVTPVEAVTKDE